jgi:hypothetical protein
MDTEIDIINCAGYEKTMQYVQYVLDMRRHANVIYQCPSIDACLDAHTSAVEYSFHVRQQG